MDPYPGKTVCDDITLMFHSMENEQIACTTDAFIRREQFKEIYEGTHCKTMLKHLCLLLESQSHHNG